MSLRTLPEPQTGPMKTRYTIIDPVPETETGVVIIDTRALNSLIWVDCEFKNAYPTYEELSWLLDPHFPDAEGWERVAVNSLKGVTDMFVDEFGAGVYCHPPLPINGLATLIYWTATVLHHLSPQGCEPSQYDELRLKALLTAATMFNEKPEDTPPRIHGRAVLFDDQVWF